jgi:hypothetical protein
MSAGVGELSDEGSTETSSSGLVGSSSERVPMCSGLLRYARAVAESADKSWCDKLSSHVNDRGLKRELFQTLCSWICN